MNRKYSLKPKFVLMLAAACTSPSLFAQCYEPAGCDGVPLTGTGSAITKTSTRGWPTPPGTGLFGTDLLHCEKTYVRAVPKDSGSHTVTSRGCGDEFKVPVIKYTEIPNTRAVLITQGSTSITVGYAAFLATYQNEGYIIVNYIAQFQPILDWDHKKPNGTCGGNAASPFGCRI